MGLAARVKKSRIMRTGRKIKTKRISTIRTKAMIRVDLRIKIRITRIWSNCRELGGVDPEIKEEAGTEVAVQTARHPPTLHPKTQCQQGMVMFPKTMLSLKA